MLVRFLEDEDGATAIEYGLIAALIAVTMIAAFVIFGNNLMALWGGVGDRTSNVMNNAGL
jgi:pilus assembly protein Flp/PilA